MPPHAELVAVCDSQAEALAAATAASGVPGFGSLAELLARSDADVVAGHAERAARATGDCRRAAGHHVLTEKPMATRFEDGQAMVRAS